MTGSVTLRDILLRHDDDDDDDGDGDDDGDDDAYDAGDDLIPHPVLPCSGRSGLEIR